MDAPASPLTPARQRPDRAGEAFLSLCNGMRLAGWVLRAAEFPVREFFGRLIHVVLDNQLISWKQRRLGRTPGVAVGSSN